MSEQTLNPLFLAQARRMTMRRAAATLVTCMAEGDKDFAMIAKRLDTDEAEVRSWLYELIDAKSNEDDIRRLADFAFACGFMLEPHARPVRLVTEEAQQQRAAA
jgi:hypothetical protein